MNKTLWAVVFLSGAMVGKYFQWEHTNAKWQSDLIERNLAVYCPDDGAFAFKGECK